MRTSFKLTNLVLAIFALAMMSMAALAADPGEHYPSGSEVSDQKAGSLLIYNFYSSNATNPQSQDTRINITNTNVYEDAIVHLFFVSGGCQVADSYMCLTPNMTATFLTSDIDPNFTGYIVAIATDHYGKPKKFNFLIGDEYIKLATGHRANLGAEAFAKQREFDIRDMNDEGTLATLTLDGADYNRAPRVLAADNIQSGAVASTWLVINGVGGSLSTGANSTGTMFGLLFDDVEQPLSFQLSGGCQKFFQISNNEPRTVPRFTSHIPAGRSGWMKLWSSSNAGIIGAQLTLNSVEDWNGGHNLHKLTLAEKATYTIPIFPASCADGY